MSRFFNFVSGNYEFYSSNLSQSEEYKLFRSLISQRRIIVDQETSKSWTLYDAGPRDVNCPIILLPPVSGTADVFFLQLLYLMNKGYRAIALDYPIYWTLSEFIHGFVTLLDFLNFEKVHVFGASLGGFLIQKFAETTFRCPRIASIILCNSFADTAIFHRTTSAAMFWMMPSVMLKTIIMGSKTIDFVIKDQAIRDSIDFMSERLDRLSQQELASRLTLNCINSYVEPQTLQDLSMTIIDVFDDCAISERVKQELYKMYPKAKRAHLKTGGNFPYLSRPDEVNLHIFIHLRCFDNTPFTAQTANYQVTYTTSD